MINIAFIGNSEPPETLLKLFRKQTPGSSGIWGKLRGVDNYKDAEFFAVIDYLPNHLHDKIDKNKCVFLGAHPESMSAYRNMDNYTCLAKYDCKNTFGFGEWWLKYDYDYLMSLKPPNKTKKLCAIVSNAESHEYHKARKAWLRRFTDLLMDEKKSKEDFNLYGRIIPDTENTKYFYHGPLGSSDSRGAASSGGNDHMSGKEEILIEHKYIVEFDAVGDNYFSERVFDDMLLWCLPIYWGGRGLHKYLPKHSFANFNIDGSGLDVAMLSNTNFYEENLDCLSKARQILLNELQLWPRVHFAILGVCK